MVFTVTSSPQPLHAPTLRCPQCCLQTRCPPLPPCVLPARPPVGVLRHDGPQQRVVTAYPKAEPKVEEAQGGHHGLRRGSR